jgi:putative nucleotidyltransferase with HDIG domain
MSIPVHAEENVPARSLQLIHALNAIALSLQESISNEENVYSIFQEQVVNLGLRGGISELDEAGEILNFKTVAFTSPIRKILTRFEKKLNIAAEGYSIPVEKVSVYRQVTKEGLSVFVADTSAVSVQVVPQQVRSIVKPLLSFLGSPPGIFAPLVYDGKIMGMLNIVGPSLTEADVPTMQAFANQIAVALENARLVEKLQSANEALETAYQKTLEGWVQALDLRDNETEGHTLRVADATVKLAQFMGVADGHLQHIRRGALLHDIGKMAIPDSILRKPGPLTEVEWQVMRQHPQMAYAWLSSIDYLKPAIDIPYCHHEHWDGSGYVQNLTEDQIPYWARIFSIIDVWDAMRSDRPYRKAIPEQLTLEYIEAESGKLFDPQVVEAFLDLRAETLKTDGADSIFAR